MRQIHGLPGAATFGLTTIFFFQAEDGIRDIGVTGVQTCALPIFAKSELTFRHLKNHLTQVLDLDYAAFGDHEALGLENGRASCRERV